MKISTIKYWYQHKTANGIWSPVQYVEVDTLEELSRVSRLLNDSNYFLVHMVDTQFGDEDIEKSIEYVNKMKIEN